MKSNNALIIPTLGNLDLLKNVINHINLQTSDDFNVIFILAREVDPEKIREKVDHLIDRNYAVIPQSGDGIIGAMNTALSLNFRIIVLTDDDAEPSPSFVENAVDFLEQYQEAGAMFGNVNGHFPDSARLKVLRGLNSFSSHKKLFGHNPKRYFNGAGLQAGTDILRITQKPVEDYLPIGVCFAWRQSSIGDFRLPDYGKRGILYESYLSSALWRKGLITYYSPSLSVNHIEKESLSRSSKISGEIMDETFQSPMVLKKMGFDVDSDAVRRSLLLFRFVPGDVGKIIRFRLNNFLNDYEHMD